MIGPHGGSASETRPAALDHIPAVPGAYILLIELDAEITMEIPRLGRPTLPSGRYAYCGSAYGAGGLRARVARHLRRDKSLRWHIDHLTSSARITAVRAVPDGSECAVLAELSVRPGVSFPVLGFGSSDCRTCSAHLAALPDSHAFDDSAMELA